ncbi:Trafficking protein particle complex subunit - like 4 [Theobroma cacao]|nr:Trafficking protein particle complex subunit - like 4 [Theobroma cacao]
MTLATLMIILVTHPSSGDLREPLKYIYNLYVEYVAKNPLYSPGTSISIGAHRVKNACIAFCNFSKEQNIAT